MNLDEGSRLYAEAMRLMKTGETRIADFHKAVDCFIKGAKLYDRFCVERLKEILETTLYRRRLSDSEAVEVREAIDAGTVTLPPNASRGVFGMIVRKPIDHAAGMAFQHKGTVVRQKTVMKSVNVGKPT